jgi:hypothetical protein
MLSGIEVFQFVHVLCMIIALFDHQASVRNSLFVVSKL